MGSKQRKKKREVKESELGGFKLFAPLVRLLERLRDEVVDPKRDLHYDQYVTLLLLYFFNPTLESLRGLQAATEFAKVRKKLGISRAALGSLSEAQHVFKADALKDVFLELLGTLPEGRFPRLSELKQVVTLVDGTLLAALPRIVWALWLNDKKRAAKAHVQFELLKDLPSRVDVTAGKGSERDVLQRTLEPGRLYVTDSGYAKYALFQAILDAGSSFLCRLPRGWNYEVVEERELTAADRKERVIRDVVVKLGHSRESAKLKQHVRVVVIEKIEEPSKRRRAEGHLRETIVLVTDRMDLPAEVIAHLYSSRWQIEVFFRWLKCTLGFKHLVAESPNGVALQLYAALIACLLVSLWTGKKPTKRTLEAICLYFQGWATADEVMASVRKLKAHDATA